MGKCVHCKSELRCHTHSFSRKPLSLRSLDLDVISMMIRKGLGLKKLLWFIVWLGLTVEIRTKTFEPCRGCESRGPAQPLLTVKCLSLLLLPWRFSFQLNDQNSPFGGRPASCGAPHEAGRAPAGAPRNTMTSAAQTWEKRSVLRTAALWAEIMTSPRVKLPGVPRVSPDSGQLFQTCIWESEGSCSVVYILQSCWEEISSL